MVNEFAEIMTDSKKALVRELESTKEHKENLFKIYKDVIYSVTQGKFNLVSNPQLLILKTTELLGEVVLNAPENVEEARNLAEKYLREKGYSMKRINQIIICVSEAATNVIKHAQKGTMQIGDLNKKIRINIYDQGAGMDYVKLPFMIFLNGFSTKISMGFGFTLLYKYADKLYLSTSNKGTFLTLDFIEKYFDEH